MRARCAIAFDLDGVLWRSPDVFPFSKTSINKVIEKQIPFVFLTNSGGYPERIKMQHINQRLDMEIDDSHLILCHTPLKQHLNHIKDEAILVSGNRDIYNVAIEYGFHNAVSTGEVISAHPSSYPFHSSHKSIELEESRKKNPNILHFDPTKISAVAILNDGCCWGSELQIMIDALMYGKKMNGNDHPLFYYTNADLVWTTHYKYPRLAQGIYAGMVMDAFKRYMIGDNPDGDVVGGNNKGWKTILVKTGVYEEGKMDPQNPFLILDNVQDAVDWIIDKHSL